MPDGTSDRERLANEVLPAFIKTGDAHLANTVRLNHAVWDILDTSLSSPDIDLTADVERMKEMVPTIVEGDFKVFSQSIAVAMLMGDESAVTEQLKQLKTEDLIKEALVVGATVISCVNHVTKGCGYVPHLTDVLYDVRGALSKLQHASKLYGQIRHLAEDYLGHNEDAKADHS